MNAPQAAFAPERQATQGEARRPLYIGANVRARVDLDGPALRVRAMRRSERRYPLYRVSRVIASPGVDWSAEALRACLESAIPIVIVAEDGTPLGLVHPARPCATRLAEAVEELLDRPDWRERYENWLRAARMRVLRDWCASREAEGEAVKAAALRELVRRHVYSAAAQTDAGIGGSCRGALYALAAESVCRWGLKPVFIATGGEPLQLLSDLVALLELRLRLEISPSMEGALERESVALRVLHALSEKLQALADRAIASLARRVRQVLAEWR
jgi:hypothetical protein